MHADGVTYDRDLIIDREKIRKRPLESARKITPPAQNYQFGRALKAQLGFIGGTPYRACARSYLERLVALGDTHGFARTV